MNLLAPARSRSLDPEEARAKVDALADRLNEIVLPAADARLAELGEAESGAYNFYAVRIAQRNLFGGYEKALAAAMLAEGMPREIHEIGGGFGTLSWLFAGLGARVTCLEHDRRRFAGAQALWIPIAMAMPELAGRLDLRADRFPAAELPAGSATAIITNIVFTTTPEQRAAILRALAGYPRAIVDVDRFLVSSGPAERPATIEEFAGAGMAGEPYLDLDKAACFWRFRSTQ